ncbi:MAG: hypothetical protein ACFFBD_26240 [Candidatus Hodarchaeota archaeon]
MQDNSMSLENVDVPIGSGYFRSYITSDEKDFVKYLLEIKEKAKTKYSLVKIVISLPFLLIGASSLLASITAPLFMLSNPQVFPLIGYEWPSVSALAFLSILSLGLFSMGIFFLTLALILLLPRSFWTPQMEETLRLMQRLKQAGVLENYIEPPTDKQPFFRLKQVSIYWDLEWSCPFLFQQYLPLLGPLSLSAQTLLLFALVPGTISLILFSLLELFTSGNLFDSLDTLLFSIPGIIIIVFLGKNFIKGIISGYYPLKKGMISKQKEKIHTLLLKTKTDPDFILVNQNNLARLYSVPNIPLPILVQAYSLFLVVYPAIAIIISFMFRYFYF